MIRRTMITLGLLVGLVACAAPPPQQIKTPPTGPKQTLPPLPIAEPDPNRLSGREAVNNFVTVVRVIEPIAEDVCRQRVPQSNCDFQIVVDDTVNAPPNAFQTEDEDGRPIIAFTISLIATVRNQDELAFIMAHEAAHHIEGHLTRLRRNASLGAEVASAIFGGTDAESRRSAQQFGAAIGSRVYSKDFELEADALGTIITINAGYDPLIGARFFQRIPDPGDRFLGTHPANAERVAIVERIAAQYQ